MHASLLIVGRLLLPGSMVDSTASLVSEENDPMPSASLRRKNDAHESCWRSAVGVAGLNRGNGKR